TSTIVAVFVIVIIISNYYFHKHITLILLIVISSLVLFSLVAVVAVFVIYLGYYKLHGQIKCICTMQLCGRMIEMTKCNCNEQHGLTLCLNTAAGEGTSSSTQGASNTQARNTQPASGESIYQYVFKRHPYFKVQ